MDYLPETIQSVLDQTFTDFEVLVIDDGSSDNVVEWSSNISDSRVRLISQKNQGLAGARNTGILHAKGELIAFLDADDLWKPTKLEKQVQYLNNDPKVGAVNTWVINIDEEGQLDSNVCKTEAEGNVWKQLIQENIVLCGSVIVARRCCFDEVGVFDSSVPGAEDWDMWIRIASNYQFALVREPLVLYRQHSSSMSSNLNNHLQSRLAVIEKTFEQVPENLQHLKNKAYGLVYLSSAWKCLQSQDYKEAVKVRQWALDYYPLLRFSNPYLRVSMSILVMQIFGKEGHERIRKFLYKVRGWIRIIKQRDIRLEDI